MLNENEKKLLKSLGYALVETLSSNICNDFRFPKWMTLEERKEIVKNYYIFNNELEEYDDNGKFEYFPGGDFGLLSYILSKL